MTENKTKFCAHCGAEIDTEATTCPNCGILQTGMPHQTPIKNEGLAAVLSFLFTGLGQIYNGEIGKAVLFLIVQFLNVILMFGTFFLWTPVYLAIWLYSVWDAYNTAKNINAAS